MDACGPVLHTDIFQSIFCLSMGKMRKPVQWHVPFPCTLRMYLPQVVKSLDVDSSSDQHMRRHFPSDLIHKSVDGIEFLPEGPVADIISTHCYTKGVREEGVLVHIVNLRMHFISFHFVNSSPPFVGRLAGCSAAIPSISCFGLWMRHTMLTATPDRCKCHDGDQYKMQGVQANALFGWLQFHNTPQKSVVWLGAPPSLLSSHHRHHLCTRLCCALCPCKLTC